MKAGIATVFSPRIPLARNELRRRNNTAGQTRRLRLCATFSGADLVESAKSNGSAEDASIEMGSWASDSNATMSDQGRIGSVKRVTKETKVDVSINLDGTGKCQSDTGIPFLDHMMDQIASHGLIDLQVMADGDTHIDDHHTCEDIALAFGQALSQALGDRKGIYRFGNFSAPLDEALIQVVLDLSGRPYLGFQCEIPAQRVGKFDTELVEHFYQSLANTGGITLHIRKLDGHNSHHIIEASFKAFARALRQAVEVDPRRVGRVPSSKGVLTQK